MTASRVTSKTRESLAPRAVRGSVPPPLPLGDMASYPGAAAPLFPATPRGGETLGGSLRRMREARHMSVAELARVTRIPTTSLEAIEDDQFDALPGDVFTRGFLRSYARAVGAVADDVLARYSASRRVSHATPIPVAAPVHAAQQGQGRRFGVAVALVLLLILFTLALSIVLKPRGRDMPAELSARAAIARSLPV